MKKRFICSILIIFSIISINHHSFKEESTGNFFLNKIPEEHSKELMIIITGYNVNRRFETNVSINQFNNYLSKNSLDYTLFFTTLSCYEALSYLENLKVTQSYKITYDDQAHHIIYKMEILAGEDVVLTIYAGDKSWFVHDNIVYSTAPFFMRPIMDILYKNIRANAFAENSLEDMTKRLEEKIGKGKPPEADKGN